MADQDSFLFSPAEGRKKVQFRDGRCDSYATAPITPSMEISEDQRSSTYTETEV
jgi:hypothetical protein